MSSFRRRSRERVQTTHNNDTQCFQMMDSLKSKASPPFKPHLKWGSLFVSSWKNILRVGGWIRTVTNCCRYGVKHLEVRRAGSERVLWNFTRSILCKRLSWQDRVRVIVRQTEESSYKDRRHSIKRDKWRGDESLGCLVPEALSWLHESASLKTSNSVFSLSLLNLFTLRFRPTRESHSEAVSHRMIWCGFIKRRCVFPCDSIITSFWRQTEISICYEEQRRRRSRRRRWSRRRRRWRRHTVWGEGGCLFLETYQLPQSNPQGVCPLSTG